jgi:hypothetical protein
MMKSGNALHDIANTFHISEFVSAEEFDVHVNSLFERCDFRIDTSNVEERLNIASTEDSCKPLAKSRQA